MRHRKASLKLNRTTSHRNAMFRNMVTSLFKHERIRTTDAKAKELRRWADQVITLAKRGDLHARRQALSIIREKGVVHKLFAEVNERFGHSAGGYTRIVKLGRRAGDAAPISLVELVPEAGAKKKTKKKAAKSAADKKKAKVDKKADAETREVKKKPVSKKKAEEEKPKKTTSKEAESKKSEKKDKPPASKKSAKAKAEEKVEAKSEKASKSKPGKDDEAS